MQFPKLNYKESLEKDVVSTRQCVGCAACVVVCPFNCLDYSQEQPLLVKKCETCGICPQICPKYDWSWSKIEEFVFGRQRQENEEFGIYRRLILAQATDKKILEKCQDGGVVTALFTYALQNGIIEGAALSGIAANKPFYPMPRLATTSQEVLENAGTRYSYSPNMIAMQEGVKQKKKSLAFVGTPCQIHAIRKIQMFSLKKYSNPLQFIVGLMCTESFTYDGLFEKHLKESMGLNLNDVEKMNIKGKVLVSMKSGEVKSVSLTEAKQYTRESCRLCNDFSAELADISAGGLGLSGWTFVVLRTEKGAEIFDGALEVGMLRTRSVNEEPYALTLLMKLSKKKRRNSPRFAVAKRAN
ncbi:MAG: Coenzyme F420 hydrogenase/dehydrogenase, beta subunit C-terminal domain [Candidatus Bathyarchaeia archaeon]